MAVFFNSWHIWQCTRKAWCHWFVANCPKWLSLWFYCHFPVVPGLAGTRMSPVWILSELRMTHYHMMDIKIAGRKKDGPNSRTWNCSTNRQGMKLQDMNLFGHVVRLDDHTPAHRALSQVAAARTSSRFGPGWRRRPGRPRHSWIQQIGDGTPFSIRAEWSKAHHRGHSGLTQQTSAVYAIWWWWWCIA